MGNRRIQCFRHFLVKDAPGPLFHVGWHKIAQLYPLVNYPAVRLVVLQVKLSQHGVQHRLLHHVATLFHHFLQIMEEKGVVLLIKHQFIFPLMNQRLYKLGAVLFLQSPVQDVVHNICRGAGKRLLFVLGHFHPVIVVGIVEHHRYILRRKS